MKTAVVATRRPESAFRYQMLLEPLGFEVKAVSSIAPMLSCIVLPTSVLLLVEDSFHQNESAHRLIDGIRQLPGRPSEIPIIRIWTKLVAASAGSEHDAVITLPSPVTGLKLEEAIKRFGLTTR